MGSWGSARYGDPCRECGFDWTISAQDAIVLVDRIPGRYAELLTGTDGSQRHPDLAWSAGAYVCHVADNLRIWAERVAGVLHGESRLVTGYDENLLARARRYDDVAIAGALWSLERSARDWREVIEEALAVHLVLVHADRGEQSGVDIARNNAHDAHHHGWDIRRAIQADGARQGASSEAPGHT
jgi:hypothetical protein